MLDWAYRLNSHSSSRRITWPLPFCTDIVIGHRPNDDDRLCSAPRDQRSAAGCDGQPCLMSRYWLLHLRFVPAGPLESVAALRC